MYVCDLLKDADLENAVDYMEEQGLLYDLSYEEKRKIYRAIMKHISKLKPVFSKNDVLLCSLDKNTFVSELDEITFAIEHYDLKSLETNITQIRTIAHMTPEWDLPDEAIKFFMEHDNDKIRLWGDCIDFSSWEEFLGWQIDEENLSLYDKNEIIAHILYEMSFSVPFDAFLPQTVEKPIEDAVLEYKPIEISQVQEPQQLQPQKDMSEKNIRSEAEEKEDFEKRYRIIQRRMLWNLQSEAATLLKYYEKYHQKGAA